MSGTPVPVSSAQLEAARAQAQARSAAQPAPSDGQPAEAKPAEASANKPEEKKAEAGAAETVKRSDETATPPDPKELEVQLDEHGLVPPFSFARQPWEHVLQWYANLSKHALDWQELPKAPVTLFVDRPHTLDETRNLLNRFLQSQGFTMLQHQRILSVRKLENINPRDVPQVSEEQLYDMQDSDYAKVTFQLPEATPVKEAAEDAKQALSPHAKVMPLMATHRLLVMDVVANLQVLSQVLNEEWAELGGYQNPKEFVLHHARAQDVIDTVYLMVGLNPNSRPSQESLQVERQRLQLLTQIQQRGTDVSKHLKDEGPPVYLAYNRQRNSIIANAPPKEMKIIARTIEQLDVPRFGAVMDPRDSGGRRMQSYSLKTLNPGTLMMALEEIGELDSLTELRADESAKALYVTADEADHRKIRDMISAMDGTGREFYVIALRNNSAADVAPTIEEMMAGKSQDNSNSLLSRTYTYRYVYDYGNSSNSDKRVPFSVRADITRNQLMMWATPEESETVRDFLGKLGEPMDDYGTRTVRTLEPRSPEETARLLEELRRSMMLIGGNQVEWDLPPGMVPTDESDKPEATTAPPAEPAAEEKDQQAGDPPQDRAAGAGTATAGRFRFAELEEARLNGSSETRALPVQDRGGEGAAATENEPIAVNPLVGGGSLGAGQPKIKVTLGPSGEIVIMSEDTAALNRIEDFARRLQPPDYKIYHIRYADALTVSWNLEDYFEDQSGSSEDAFYRLYYGISMPSSSSGSSLSQQQPIRFIADIDTKTILVRNASPSQLRVIDDLIATYDRPIRSDSITARVNKIFKLRYAKATDVAEAIKDVYRDLLSSKDKAFERNGNNERQSTQARSTTYYLYPTSGSDRDRDSASNAKATFEGQISIGVSEGTDSILVSASEYWMPSVERMILELDEMARTPAAEVSLRQTNGGLGPEALQQALFNALGAQASNSPEQEALRREQERDQRREEARQRREQEQQNNQNNQNNQNGRRGN